MLGGGDTGASVVGSGGGNVAAAAGSSGARDGSGEAAAVGVGGGNVVVGSNGSNNNNNNNNSGGEEERGGGRGEEGGERSSMGGNRWPRQETLALLKIRSDMDVTFRDASVKGPLWEEVSRKLGELGYHRSAKKCKEKFENVYKYHKRTKDGRTGKSEGKTYRFFDQLQALESHPSFHHLQSHSPALPPPMPAAAAAAAAPTPPNPISLPQVSTVPSTTTFATALPSVNVAVPSTANLPITIPASFPTISADLMSNSTSSSTSSDLELEGRRKRKRKWKDFFERLMKEVIQKQEDMQKKFLEAIEKREHERMVREEAWRMQEMSRINREREILAQERSIAAAKDAAVMAFLQKLSDQQNPAPQPQPQAAAPQPVAAAVAPPPPPAVAAAAAAPAPPRAAVSMDVSKTDNGDQIISYTPGGASSSRWPKVEVEALIKLRTNMDAKYQENGPKGPLWEEISAAMKKLGYNRNAKRCKEKWENINKYFKKVKESNKKRPDDSKTCPYFHQLDALYREKNKFDTSSASNSNQLKPENSVPLMVRPEQQWPPPPPHHPTEPHHQQQQQQQRQHGTDHDHAMEDMESDPNQDDDDDDDGDEDGDDGDDEEEDEGGGYELVASKPVSMGTGE